MKAQLALTSEASFAQWGLPPRPPPSPLHRGEGLRGGSEGTIDHNHIPQNVVHVLVNNMGNRRRRWMVTGLGPHPWSEDKPSA